MKKRLSVREELRGKTEMNLENENDLFLRLEEIEKNGEIVASLAKSDWLFMGISFFGFGILPLLYYGIKLI